MIVAKFLNYKYDDEINEKDTEENSIGQNPE